VIFQFTGFASTLAKDIRLGTEGGKGEMTVVSKQRCDLVCPEPNEKKTKKPIVKHWDGKVKSNTEKENMPNGL